MVRHPLARLEPQKFTQGPGVRTAPFDPAFRVDPLSNSQAIGSADTVTITSADSLTLKGWMSLQADVGATVVSVNAGRYHQVDVAVTPTATWHAAEIQALQLRYTPAGSY